MSYLGLAAAFLSLAAAAAAWATVRRGLTARWWATTALTTAILLGLTVVFDSLMIAADLFRFDQRALLGVRLWRAPVEDLAWPLVAGLLLPSLRKGEGAWTTLGAALEDAGAIGVTAGDPMTMVDLLQMGRLGVICLVRVIRLRFVEDR